MHCPELTVFHSAVWCCKNTFQKYLYNEKHCILARLYHDVKLISLSGHYEQIYILDLAEIARILQNVLEKDVKREI